MVDLKAMHGKIYPYGKFTIGYCKPKKVTDREREYDALHRQQYEEHKYYAYSYRGREEKSLIEWKSPERFESDCEAVGLSIVSNSHKEPQARARRGLKGVSSYARDMIKSGAYLLEERFGLKRLALLTCTLPMPVGFRHELWSELVRCFVQELRRELLRKGGSGHIVGCVEIQEARYITYGEVCPHLHLIFEAHKGDWKYYLNKDYIRKIWERILGNVLGLEVRLEAEIHKNSTRIESIKKSAKNYIGKYMSKGGKVIAKIIEDGNEQSLPSCWWVCTLILKRFIKKNIIRIFDFIRDGIINRWDMVGEKILKWVYPVNIDWKGDSVLIGYVGEICGYGIPAADILSGLP